MNKENEQRRSKTSENYINISNTGKQHDAKHNMRYKHRQQHWQSGHGKYIRLYNTGLTRVCDELGVGVPQQPPAGGLAEVTDLKTEAPMLGSKGSML
jgi:hypothetical protein